MTKNIMKAHTTERKQQISSTLIYQIVSSRGHFNTWSNILNLHPCLCDAKSFILLKPFPLQDHLWCHSFIFFSVSFSHQGQRLKQVREMTPVMTRDGSHMTAVVCTPESIWLYIFLHLQTWQCLFSIELEVAFRSIDHVPFSVCLYLFHQPIPSDHIPIEIPGFFTN